jgi:sensor histidine kinase YesM
VTETLRSLAAAPQRPPLAAGAGAPEDLRDGRVRLLGIPFFGTIIPNATGLFGHLGPRDPAYWAGYAWFVLLAYVVWQGNRWLWIRQRRHFDWFRHPARKVVALLFASVFYTAPVTVLMLWLWYRVAPLPAIDWTAIRVVAAVNVICVIFITHVYETAYLIQQRESDLLAVERLDRARAEAELQALRTQIDPHFLFNSLNTLAHFVDHDPRRARQFTERLAEIYRYLLRNRDRDLVPLADELAFAERYVELLRLRFGDALRLEVEADGRQAAMLPPMALQVLLENVVKHNEMQEASPLPVRIRRRGDRLEVANLRRPKREPARPSGLGLANLAERAQRLSGRPLEVVGEGDEFRVAVPLVEAVP